MQPATLRNLHFKSLEATVKFKYSIIDEFLDHPLQVRTRIDELPCLDIEAEDGVTYPHIVDLMNTPEGMIVAKSILQFYPKAKITKLFARYTYQSEKPPHWAHSDKEMTPMLALIYLNKRQYSTTYLVKHNDLETNTHPNTGVGKITIKDDSNNTFKWEIEHTIKGHYNQCLFLNADYLHAAGNGYGDKRFNARMVVTCFFDPNAG